MTVQIVCQTCWCGPCVCDVGEVIASAPMAPRPSGCTRCPYHCPGLPRSEGVAALLYACERAYRSTCATMGPSSDLARTLAQAIFDATGEAPAGAADERSQTVTKPLTIQDAQTHQPWTVPYSAGVRSAERYWVSHILGSHVALHAAKSVGKLAGVFEALDHSEEPITEAQRQTVKDMAADLMTAALRLANLYQFSLADELVRRVEEKNGVGIARGRATP